MKEPKRDSGQNLLMIRQCVPGIFATFSKVGEEQQKIVKEARENLKLLEGELDKKRFFGDTRIGFIDVASAWIICWAQIVEEIIDIKLIDAEEMPSLVVWFQNILEAAPIEVDISATFRLNAKCLNI